MSRKDCHPLEFLAAEAASQRPVTGLVLWEAEGAFKVAVWPEGSRMVLIGAVEMLTRAMHQQLGDDEAADDDDVEEE